MRFRVRIREFLRFMYATIFGSFDIRKIINKADLLLCDSLGHPLLNIRDCKCETVTNYSSGGVTLSVAVYGANFYPHAYRLVTTDINSPILREYKGDVRGIGEITVFDEKMTSIRFYGEISEAHDHIGIVAAAPVVTVSDKYKDDFIASEDHLIRDDNELTSLHESPGLVRYVPLIAYSGKGHVYA